MSGHCIKDRNAFAKESLYGSAVFSAGNLSKFVQTALFLSLFPIPAA
jgi:hypothetical protein